jgi:hypothetical protein
MAKLLGPIMAIQEPVLAVTVYFQLLLRLAVGAAVIIIMAKLADQVDQVEEAALVMELAAPVRLAKGMQVGRAEDLIIKAVAVVLAELA